MIRHIYFRNFWTFPGTRVRVQTPHEESPLEAVERLLSREYGIAADNLVYIGSYFASGYYRHDSVCCFYGTVKSTKVRLQNPKVLEAKFIPRDTLPEFVSFTVPEVMKLYRAYKMHRLNISRPMRALSEHRDIS